jgi:hypothetical protein
MKLLMCWFGEVISYKELCCISNNRDKAAEYGIEFELHHNEGFIGTPKEAAAEKDLYVMRRASDDGELIVCDTDVCIDSFVDTSANKKPWFCNSITLSYPDVSYFYVNGATDVFKNYERNLVSRGIDPMQYGAPSKFLCLLRFGKDCNLIPMETYTHDSERAKLYLERQGKNEQRINGRIEKRISERIAAKAARAERPERPRAMGDIRPVPGSIGQHTGEETGNRTGDEVQREEPK